VLDYEDVRRLLPQAHPFIFIDRVLDFEPKRRIVCRKNVTGSESYFPGHFPGLAIMPGALLGEAIAQASILLFVLSEEVSPEEDGRLFVVGTTRTRFLKPVFPGDTLCITVEVVKLLSTSALVRGWIETDGVTVVTSRLALAAIDAAELKIQKRSLARSRVTPEGSL
jgi:3-hydroxyacyl-[acyl-carrier-protein] dehydratase